MIIDISDVGGKGGKLSGLRVEMALEIVDFLVVVCCTGGYGMCVLYVMKWEDMSGEIWLEL